MPGRTAKTEQSAQAPDKIERTRREVLLFGISVAAIIMFVGTGGSAMTSVVRWLQGAGLPPDRLLTNTLLMNVALIIFGWRRYSDLRAEVSERGAAEAHARVLADTDPLTGSLNRRAIVPATDALRETSTASGRTVAMILIDLDNFKRLNDTHGHAAGDEVLRESVRRMRAVAPSDALIARLGGDEFAIAMAVEPGRVMRVEQVASRLIDALGHAISIDGHVLEGISVSIGLAVDAADATGASAQDLMHRADIAMYQAKKSGKNSYCWYDAQMENELRFRNELETGIRSGIQSGEFVPYYEPQVDLAGGGISGFEMLARWDSPQFGLVGPEVFIPIAEEIGVISDLSEVLVRRALDDARGWSAELTLSVNISPIQLRDPWFAQRLLKLLVEANFPPSRLEIEITESCLHENLGLVRSLITSLKNQGVQISLDDFGTGYSSLSQLRSLPFDRIKIDRSFISTLSDNRDSLTIVEAIASLGNGLGLPITAEGVEDAAVADRLRELGDFKAQGYLYGRPETAAQVRDRLRPLGLLQGEVTAEVAQTILDNRHSDAA